MNAWSSTAAALALFFQEYGIAMVSVLLFVKSAGLPLPLPGDLLMLVIGGLAAQDAVPLGVAWVSFSVAIFAGAVLLFSVIRHYGRRPVSKYGHYVGLTEARVEHAEGEIDRHGWGAVAVGRMVPGVRLATAVAAGTFNVHPSTFATAAAASAFIEVGVCLLIGATLGPLLAAQADDQVPFHLPVAQLAIILIVLVVVIALVRFALTLSRHGSRLSKD